jgi:hypothetical protein
MSKVPQRTGDSAPEHARLPPSASARWVPCKASVGYIEGLISTGEISADNRSEHSDTGVKAHDLAARILNGERRLVWAEDADMLVNVRAYVDFCRSKVEPGDRFWVERRVPLFYRPTQRGTIDFPIVGKNRIVVIDYKNGVGVGVYAENNTQLASYAESLVQELEMVESVPDDMPVEMHIFQPRDCNDSEPVRSWIITRKELREFAATINEAAQLIDQGLDLRFVAGSHCDKAFCPARGHCKTYAAQGLEAVSDEAPVDVVIAKPLLMPLPASLTRDQRVRIISKADQMRSWLNAVEAQELQELLAGAKPLGFKVVATNTHRKWSDEEAVITLMATKRPIDEVAPRSPLSPAQAEKLFKSDKEFVGALVGLQVKPQGKPVLVAESDKRPQLVLNPSEGLDDIDLI